MSQRDRQKWNEKYSAGSHTAAEPSPVLKSVEPLLSRLSTASSLEEGRRKRALDVGGGAGRHALWLAQFGFEVTLADISSVALALAARRATDAGVAITCREIDLQEEPFPSGPWDVIVAFHFLERPLFPSYVESLAPGGLLIMVQPTLRNLERHEKPSAEYLLAEHEMPTLIPSLCELHYEEGWLADGRHEALIVLTKP